MAAYGFRRSGPSGARSREWKREERDRDFSDGVGLVRILAAHYCDGGIVGDDFEYSSPGSVDR